MPHCTPAAGVSAGGARARRLLLLRLARDTPAIATMLASHGKRLLCYDE